MCCAWYLPNEHSTYTMRIPRICTYFYSMDTHYLCTTFVSSCQFSSNIDIRLLSVKLMQLAWKSFNLSKLLCNWENHWSFSSSSSKSFSRVHTYIVSKIRNKRKNKHALVLLKWIIHLEMSPRMRHVPDFYHLCLHHIE